MATPLAVKLALSLIKYKEVRVLPSLKSFIPYPNEGIVLKLLILNTIANVWFIKETFELE